MTFTEQDAISILQWEQINYDNVGVDNNALVRKIFAAHPKLRARFSYTYERCQVQPHETMSHGNSE